MIALLKKMLKKNFNNSKVQEVVKKPDFNNFLLQIQDCVDIIDKGLNNIDNKEDKQSLLIQKDFLQALSEDFLLQRHLEAETGLEIDMLPFISRLSSILNNVHIIIYGVEEFGKGDYIYLCNNQNAVGTLNKVKN